MLAQSKFMYTKRGRGEDKRIRFDGYREKSR